MAWTVNRQQIREKAARLRGLLKSIDKSAKIIEDVRTLLVRYLTGEISDEQALEIAAGATIEN